MNNILIMIRKQMKDTFKNKAVLIQLILLPVVSFILERVIRPEGVPELEIVLLSNLTFWPSASFFP